MRRLQIEKPILAQLSEGVHLAAITAAAPANMMWTVDYRIEEGGQTFELKQTFPIPVQPDSPLLDLITAAENKERHTLQLEDFDMDTLVSKRVVLGVVHKKSAGGRITPAIVLVLSITEVKEFAAALKPTQAQAQEHADA